MSILRIVDFTHLDENMEYFLSQFLIHFLSVSADDIFTACVARIGEENVQVS